MHMYFKLDSVNSNVYLHYKHKKYNVKISDTIACRNVLFASNLKKNKHT